MQSFFCMQVYENLLQIYGLLGIVRICTRKSTRRLSIKSINLLKNPITGQRVQLIISPKERKNQWVWGQGCGIRERMWKKKNQETPSSKCKTIKLSDTGGKVLDQDLGKKQWQPPLSLSKSSALYQAWDVDPVNNMYISAFSPEISHLYSSSLL